MSRRLGLLSVSLLFVSSAVLAEGAAAVTVPLRVDKGVIFFDVIVSGLGQETWSAPYRLSP